MDIQVYSSKEKASVIVDGEVVSLFITIYTTSGALESTYHMTI